MDKLTSALNLLDEPTLESFVQVLQEVNPNIAERKTIGRWISELNDTGFLHYVNGSTRDELKVFVKDAQNFTSHARKNPSGIMARANMPAAR